MGLVWIIIVVLLILWLLGFLGPRFNAGFPNAGNGVHILIVVVVILVILSLLRVI